MSRRSSFAFLLASTALAGVASSQTGAGAGVFHGPGLPGPFDPGPDSFSVRVEQHAVYERTAGTSFVNVPGAASSFVAAADGTNVCVTFSAEAYTTAVGKRLFLRALLDGQPMSPGDVVFAQGPFDGPQSFTFAGTVDAGVHSVEMQWEVDANAEAFLGNGALLIEQGLRAGDANSLAWTVPPSGAAVQTSLAAWSDVPGCTLTFYVPKKGTTILSFSAEAFVEPATGGATGRMFVRALVDGAPIAPSDVVLTESIRPESLRTNFGVLGLAPGWHTANVQWLSANGGAVYLGDRSMAVSSGPRSSLAGHYFVAAPSGPTLVKSDGQWEAIPGLSLSPSVPENGEIALSVSAEVKTDPGTLLQLRLANQGQVVSDTLVAFAEDAGVYETRTFTFDAKHVFAPGGAGGAQTLSVEWRTFQGNAYLGDRSVAAFVEPGNYPDLAEGAPFGWLPIEPAIGVRPVLTLLHDPHRAAPNDVKPPVAAFADGLFGPHGVRDYYEKVSGNRFSISNAGIIGWVPGAQDENHYWNHPECGESGSDGFSGGHQERWFEALSAADAAIDFSAFDANGDGIVLPQELVIFIVAPQFTGGGDARNFTPFCNGTFPTFDGVIIAAIGEWFTSDPVGDWNIAAHELAHLALGLGDMYVQPGDSWTEPNRLSLMGNNVGTSTYLDPFHRLALGWALPVEVEQGGVIDLEDVRSSEVVYVLPRRVGGDGEEYFLLENREHADSDPDFDEGIIDAGIAVWHVVEESGANQYAPACLDQMEWEELTNSPLRRGVRLIRPWFTSGWSFETLWKSSDYDLLDHDPVCPEDDNYAERRNVLQWADGSESGWQLLNFSAPGAVTSVLVEKQF